MQYPFSDGQVIVMEGSVENGKQWWLDVPGTPCALAAECGNKTEFRITQKAWS